MTKGTAPNLDFLNQNSVSVEDFSFQFEELESGNVKDCYDSQGAVIIKGLFSQEEMKGYSGALHDLCCARLASFDPNFEAGALDLDGVYNRLWEVDPDSRYHVRGIAKDHIQFFQFMLHQKIQAVIQKLLGTKQVQINQDVNLLRVDSPSKDAENFAWHQDYAYNFMSKTAITAWMPVTELSRDMGLLKVIPGSHRECLPLDLCLEGKAERYTDHRRLRISGLDEYAASFNDAAVDVDNLEYGDVLFFHSLTLHCSGANRSSRSRFVYNARFGDVMDEEMVSRGWVCERIRDLFPIARYSPELVNIIEEPTEALFPTVAKES